MSRRRNLDLRPQVDLGRDDRLMTWSSNLNIYRVNRFNVFDLNETKKAAKTEVKFDLIEQLLRYNLVHVVEDIFLYVGFESALECLLVCRLWNEFLSYHLFKRWAERLVDRDESLQELARAEKWTAHLHADDDAVEDVLVYRKICMKIFELREVWRFREPKSKRLFCDSFVLSLKFSGDSLYCGLNNGTVQLWDLDWMAKKREQEMHEKGVKCMDLNDLVLITGSYDCTARIWKRSDWEQLYAITIHTDSVWDLVLHGWTLATASLDGTVAMFEIDYDGNEMEVLAVMILQVYTEKYL